MLRSLWLGVLFVVDVNKKIALNVTEASELLGVSRPVVYQLMHRRDFPAFKVGGRTLISRAGLEEWVNKQATKFDSII